MNMGKKAEDVVRKQLEAVFRLRFTTKKIVVGSKSRSFDFVSDEGTIVAQVKSCSKTLENLTVPQLDTRF